MARIPKFEQERLASSLVGTPGVDTSEQQTFNSISNTFGNIAEGFGQMAVKRQEAKDKALANKTNIGLDLQLEEDLRAHQTQNAEFRGDPMERIRAFEQIGRKRVADVVNGVPSRGARDIVALEADKIFASKIAREADEANKNQGILAFNDTVDSANTLALSASNLGLDTSLSLDQKAGRLMKLMQQGQKVVADSAAVLSAEQKRKLETDVPQMILRGAISTLTTNNPEELLVMLKSDEVRKQFQPEELAKFEKDAKTNLEKAQENRELDAVITSLTGATTLIDRLKQNDPTLLTQVENMEPSEFTEAFKEYFINKPVDPVSKAVSKYELLTDLEALEVKNEKDKKPTMKGSADEAMAFMVKATKMAQDGAIEQSDYTKFITAVGGPFTDKIKARKSGGFAEAVFISPVIPAFRMVRDWFARNKIDNKNDLISVMDDFDALLVKGGKVSNESIALATKTALRNYMVKRDPRLGIIQGSPNSIIKDDRDLLQGIPGQSSTPPDGKTKAGAGVDVKTGTLADGRRVRDTFENGKLVKRELI